MPLNPSETLNNRYRIVKLLGQGGFGAVYRAWDTRLNGPIALKENFDTSPAAQKQFALEASILFNLRHPNLPRVMDHFSLPTGQYLVMDYIEGEDLQEKLNQASGPLPVMQVLPWIEQICDALTYLHRQNPPIIHRDLKPANIRITPQGQAMLVDFGIAKVYDAQAKTTMGARAVTPGYSPFEQYGQGRTDARTDVYALGATLYNVLTMVEPVESIHRLMGDTLTEPVNFVPALSQEVNQAILKAMALQPDRRYPDIASFRTALLAPVKVSPAHPTPTQIAHLPASRPPVQPVAPITPPAVAQVAAPYQAPKPTLVAPSPVQRLPFEPEMIYIPAGPFWMGTNQEKNESPRHHVELDAYYIGKYPVTNEQYQVFVKDMKYPSPVYWLGDEYPSGKGEHPVVYVDWDDADSYCQWLADKTGRTYRLPTEAEWEKAARGLDERTYPWGNDAPSPWLLNYDGEFGDTTTVGQYEAGASYYGVYDMAGNVWEWVADWYDKGYYKKSPVKNPTGPANGDRCVLRGGCWDDPPDVFRATNRDYDVPNYKGNDTGFRCAYSP